MSIAKSGKTSRSQRPVNRTVWVLEDQLSLTLSALTHGPEAPVLMIESRVTWQRVPFHKKRLTYLAAAMRHFADELRATGRDVRYHPLRPADGPYRDSVTALKQHIAETGCRRFVIAEPSEWHTKHWLLSLEQALGIEIEFTPNNLFLTDRDAFRTWARSLKSPVMEHFYRRMRKQHRVLMDGDEPAGREWNFDKSNRKPAPAGLRVPRVPAFAPDAITRAAMEDVEAVFPTHPGTTAGFDLPVTRADARAALADFIQHRLPRFGDYEDAMVTGQPVLFHSLLSAPLNAGLLSPLECVHAAEKAYETGGAPLNCVEGFVRQILGWREYVYGIYWSFMPEYRDRNARKSEHDLPDWFWSGDTDLNCLRQCVGGVVDRAYSHHIQRLMVLCNFATLAGLSPQAVNDWFYAMYVDSHDWVVTPNVVGMGMNADNGTMATKPYVSSGAYINRMSDYCDGCRYDVTTRDQDDSCPFNYLYWTFLEHFRKQYAANPRMTMILKNLDRIADADMRAMMKQRKRFIEVHVKGRAYEKTG